MLHALKCHPQYYQDVIKGNKLFELRKDDRPFKEFDTLVLQEYDPATEKYTGGEATFTITYILRDAPKFGLKPGYCILQLKEKEI